MNKRIKKKGFPRLLHKTASGIAANRVAAHYLMYLFDQSEVTRYDARNIKRIIHQYKIKPNLNNDLYYSIYRGVHYYEKED